MRTIKAFLFIFLCCDASMKVSKYFGFLALSTGKWTKIDSVRYTWWYFSRKDVQRARQLKED